jgi:hypothetical protein
MAQAPDLRTACAAAVALLVAEALDRSAMAQDAGGGGAAASFLAAGPAALGDGARIRERQVGLRVWSRKFSFDRTAFKIGADYAYTRYSFDGVPTRPRDLHHLHVPLSWGDRDGRWVAVVTPVVATSSNVFKDFLNRGGRDDMDLHVRLDFRHWHGPNLGWRMGVVRDNAFGQARVYPAAALLWKGQRVRAALGLPSSQVDWHARDRLMLGATVFPTGGSWHVVSDERGGAQFDYRARAWRGALTAQWQPWPWLRASAQAGIEFRRHYEFEDDTGAAINRDAGSAGYYRLELRFEFPG